MNGYQGGSTWGLKSEKCCPYKKGMILSFICYPSHFPRLYACATSWVSKYRLSIRNIADPTKSSRKLTIDVLYTNAHSPTHRIGVSSERPETYHCWNMVWEWPPDPRGPGPLSFEKIPRFGPETGTLGTPGGSHGTNFFSSKFFLSEVIKVYIMRFRGSRPKIDMQAKKGDSMQ